MSRQCRPACVQGLASLRADPGGLFGVRAIVLAVVKVEKGEELPERVRAYFEKMIAEQVPEEELGTDSIALLIAALRDVTSLQVVRSMLRDQAEDYAYSSQKWSHFLEKRVRPVVEDGNLTEDDLLNMLHVSEEYGRQHVLLYRIKPEHDVAKILSSKRVRAQLRAHEQEDLLDALPEPVAPAELELVHVRLDDDGLVLKAIESKESIQIARTYDFDAGHELRVAVARKKRRVKLARLHRNGLLEVRLGAIAIPGRQHKYAGEAWEFLGKFAYLIERTQFKEVTLDKFRKKIWRVTDPDRIVVRGQDGATAGGDKLMMRAKDPRSDVSSNPAFSKTFDTFLNEPGTTADQAEIVWKKQEQPALPATDVVVRLSGASGGTGHEFIIRQHCTQQDFEYVLSEIRRYGGF